MCTLNKNSGANLLATILDLYEGSELRKALNNPSLSYFLPTLMNTTIYIHLYSCNSNSKLTHTVPHCFYGGTT